MIDLDRLVGSLLAGSAEEWAVATDLLEKERARHALFFAHLALEKLLKALVARKIADIPPRVHNLVRLTELADLKPSPEQLDLLIALNPYNIAGRYPEMLGDPPTLAEAQTLLARAKEVATWLQSLL